MRRGQVVTFANVYRGEAATAPMVDVIDYDGITEQIPRDWGTAMQPSTPNLARLPLVGACQENEFFNSNAALLTPRNRAEDFSYPQRAPPGSQERDVFPIGDNMGDNWVQQRFQEGVDLEEQREPVAIGVSQSFQARDEPLNRLARLLADNLSNNSSNLDKNNSLLINRMSQNKNLPRFTGDPLDWKR